MKNINWKQIGAAVASALTFLAALPYSMGDIATVIPPEWKGPVFKLGVLSMLVLRFWNAILPHQVNVPPTQPQPESKP